MDEFRSAMGALPQDGIEASAQTLFQVLEGSADQREDYWRNRVQPFWQQAWPKSRDLVTPRLAKRLTLMSIAARGEFPAALAAVKDCKRVFGLVKDFGTSQSPKSTRPLTTYLCPRRPGHQALRNNFASSLLLRTCLPMTGRRVWMPTLLPLWRYAHDG